MSNMTKTNLTTFIILSICLVIASCSKYNEYGGHENYTDAEWETISQELNLPIEVYYYFYRPDEAVPSPTDRLVTLGRVLFYDKDLSIDGSVSCGSCHQQQYAFSDNVAFSIGAHGNLTDRNSYPLGSFFTTSGGGYYSAGEQFARLFWDKRAGSVVEQLQETMKNPKEMGMSPEGITSVIKSKPYYQVLFKLANQEMTNNSVNSALQAFIGTFESDESRFDQARFYHNSNGNYKKFMTLTDTMRFTVSEDRGKKLFNVHCNNCHDIELGRNPFIRTTGPEANNGLNKIYKDKGVGNIIENSNYNGVFKLPELRNVARTAPYMHDGRFANLHEVIDFYSSGIQDHPNLNNSLQDENGKPKRFNFTDLEKDDLVNFLHTLTDETLISHEKWSDPFKK